LFGKRCGIFRYEQQAGFVMFHHFGGAAVIGAY
jgi:hypothetical protein